MSTFAQTTQGCRLYFIDENDAVAYVDALKNFSGAGGQKKKIDITNQDSESYNEFVGGLIDPGNPSGTIIFNQGSAAHLSLKKLQESNGGVTQWYFAFGDAANTEVPTIVSGVLTPPDDVSNNWTRSGFLFSGYVDKFQYKADTDDVIMADFGVQASGAIKIVVKGEANTVFN